MSAFPNYRGFVKELVETLLDNNRTVFRSELVKALSEEMLAKFAELKEENSALKERISSLETGLTDKLDTITSELAALRKQVSSVLSLVRMDS